MAGKYICYINGKFYGSGSLEYIQELFNDYVVYCKMYGKSEVEFKIVKDKEFIFFKDLELNLHPEAYEEWKNNYDEFKDKWEEFEPKYKKYLEDLKTQIK